MKTLSTKAIILGYRELGESDKVIHFYTEEIGKIQVIAKGSRKISSKFTGHLETLNICQISLYFGPKNIILTEIQTLINHEEIRNELEKLTHGLKIAEVTNQMVYENQHIPELSELLEESISAINNNEKPYLTSIYYLIKLLDKLGFMPDLAQSASSLEEKYHKFLSYIQKNNLRDIQKIQLQEEEKSFINSLIQELIERETERPMRCFRFQTNPL